MPDASVAKEKITQVPDLPNGNERSSLDAGDQPSQSSDKTAEALLNMRAAEAAQTHKEITNLQNQLLNLNTEGRNGNVSTARGEDLSQHAIPIQTSAQPKSKGVFSGIGKSIGATVTKVAESVRSAWNSFWGNGVDKQSVAKAPKSWAIDSVDSIKSNEVFDQNKVIRDAFYSKWNQFGGENVARISNPEMRVQFYRQTLTQVIGALPKDVLDKIVYKVGDTNSGFDLLALPQITLPPLNLVGGKAVIPSGFELTRSKQNPGELVVGNLLSVKADSNPENPKYTVTINEDIKNLNLYTIQTSVNKESPTVSRESKQYGLPSDIEQQGKFKLIADIWNQSIVGNLDPRAVKDPFYGKDKYNRDFIASLLNADKRAGYYQKDQVGIFERFKSYDKDGKSVELKKADIPKGYGLMSVDGKIVPVDAYLIESVKGADGRYKQVITLYSQNQPSMANGNLKINPSLTGFSDGVPYYQIGFIEV